MRLRRNMLRLLVACVIAAILPVADAYACLICKKSPNGWGFCRYYSYAGGDWCEDYVADPFNGTTWCTLYGYCNWNDTTSLSDGGNGEPAFGCGFAEVSIHEVGIF